ncbi:NXPE family member 3-like isoform X2 [Salarias fasciatus]|uniref:NXPE family member 3-like isoform X2 n=2 Tax=Salarias fasciatus TaxID=181472 RepID=UPI001176DF7C|nr:NXPE family member 3-like isoform X2 [Salarias fasciatus]
MTEGGSCCAAVWVCLHSLLSLEVQTNSISATNSWTSVFWFPPSSAKLQDDVKILSALNLLSTEELVLSPASAEAVAVLHSSPKPPIMEVLQLYHTELGHVYQYQNKSKPSVNISSVTSHQSFCSFRPISPEEAVEEEFILESIAWPTYPSKKHFYPLANMSYPACGKFSILPRRGGGSWRIGDQLEVLIQIQDYHCRPKKYGGDVLLASLHNSPLQAGVVGQVVDHLNGTYSAVFTLLWKGSAKIEVTLVHSSEAVEVLRRLTSEQPDRIYFKSLFRSGSYAVFANCSICLRPSQAPLCNYTDIHTGEPWFCYKPKNLSCDARINHSKGGFAQNLRPNEVKLFESEVNMKVPIRTSGPSDVFVTPKIQDGPNSAISSGRWKPSGFYYKGVWRSLGGDAVRKFNPKQMTQCLKGKQVHMYGDSTIRQWFEYLNEVLPGIRPFGLYTSKQTGPLMALDYTNKIMVTYRCHGPPIRFNKVLIGGLSYIANELESVIGGRDTIIVLGIWSHFSTFPMEVYIRRLMSIRRAVVKLLARAPETLVIVRTANLKNLTLYETLTNSDWYSMQRDKALRAVFKGTKVHLVDAWEMTLAHNLPHKLHPDRPIIKNMINVLLSYVCPAKGG